jgi:hypothetical protein
VPSDHSLADTDVQAWADDLATFVGAVVVHFADDAYAAPGEARKLAEALVELADYAEGLR